MIQPQDGRFGNTDPRLPPTPGGPPTHPNQPGQGQPRRPPRLTLEVDFWLATLSPSGGRLLNARYLGIGLMGATLADLIGYRFVSIEDGHVVLRPNPQRPDDSTAEVLAAMGEERRPRTVQDWLRGLGHTADERVTERVLREEFVQRDRKRWYDRGPRYLPAPGVQPERLVAQLAIGLPSGEALPPRSVMLGGLLDATGLDELIVGDIDPAAARVALAEQVGQLPTALRTLLNETVAAIGGATMHGP